MIISIWYFVSFILLYFVLLFTEVLSRDSARKLQQITHHQIWIPQVRNLFSHSPLTGENNEKLKVRLKILS